jgi:N-acetylmuramoyl-L-alanine amidase
LREIDKIVIHCADTPGGVYFDVDDIRRWHVTENGWSDVGYHYVILLDGTIQKGRQDDVPGAHVKNHNSKSIGVCYIGGKEGDTRTFEQRQSLAFLLSTLIRMYPDAEVMGHSDLDSKKPHCPGFPAKTEYKWVVSPIIKTDNA